MPAISVIIPCYKAENYIQRPIRSLLQQRFTDWEAILVSDDQQDYKAIIEKLELSDERLRFVDTGTIGTRQANARNVGISHAASSLITYLDNDDAYMPEYLEKMMPLVQAHGVTFANQIYIQDGTNQTIPFYDILSGQDGLYDLPNFWKLMIPPTAIAIAHDKNAVPAQWFKDAVIAEDVLFPLSCYAYVDAIYAIGEPLYYYYRRQDSTSNNPQNSIGFVAEKEKLLRLISSGKLLGEPALLSEYAYRYLKIAYEAEKIYAVSLPSNPQTLYTDCVVAALRNMELL